MSARGRVADMSVFLSWSGADRTVKDVLAERLKDEDITFWESDEKCQSDFSEECIAAIKRSSVFVVLISEASMDKKSYVFNEVIEARNMENEGKLNILVYKLTDQPYTNRFAMQLNHVTDSNHVSRIRNLGAAGGIDLLVRRIKYLLKCRAEGNPEKPYDVYHPNIAGQRPSAMGYFVPSSRDGVISRIEEGFSRSNVVIVTELFGFGRRSVVRKYISTHGYNTAVEVHSAHDTLRGFFLHGLHFTNVNPDAFELDSAEKILRKKFELLRKLDEKEIIVITGADIEDEPDELIMELLSTLRCHVVIITQKTSNAYRDRFPVIDVGRMEREHLTELFFHYYDASGKADREPLLPALTDFFESIGGHTKTVEVAASVLEREMKSDPDEVVRYLTRGSDDGRDLNEKIVDKLSGLIDMERFSEEDQRILLVISLVANPTVGLKELYNILGELGIADGLDVAIRNLGSNRWISYDRFSGTVYIEPIIARICVSRFIDYRVASGCLKYFVKLYSSSVHKDAVTVLGLFARVEAMLRLVDMDLAADMIKAQRNVSIKNMDVDEAGAVIDAYVAWYKSSTAEGAVTEQMRGFILIAAAFINVNVLTALRLASLMPVLLKSGGTVSRDTLDGMLGEMYGEIADEELLDALADVTGASDALGGINVISELCSSVNESFLCNDLGALTKSVDAIIDELERNPAHVEDTETADQVLVVVRLINTVLTDTGADRACASMLERLISLPWPTYHFHRLLLTYANLLVSIGGSPDDAVSVMENAEELLLEIAAGSFADPDELDNIKREHAITYSYALLGAGRVDDAMERFAEFRTLGVRDLGNAAIDIVYKINDALLTGGRKSDAVAFIRESLDMINEAMESKVLSDERIRDAETLLLIAEHEGRAESSLSRGGAQLSESYYQHYPMKGVGSFITMMPYKRVADGVRRFSFSDCTDSELAQHTERLRARAMAGEDRMKIASEAFALVSEAGYRVLGYRHHAVQYVGAAVMLSGKIAEILNGEGKTYTIPLVAYVNSLYGGKVFVVDSSRYLTERNYKWMRGVFSLLGLKTNVLLSYNAAGIDEMIADSDVIYAEFANLGFYVNNRELSGKSAEDERMLGGSSVIIDEADSILVESAAMPIMLTGKPMETPKRLERARAAYEIAGSVYGNSAYYSTDRFGYVTLKSEIYPLIEELAGIRADSTADVQELSLMKRSVVKAIRALGFVNGRDYFVHNGQILYEDESRGTLSEISSDFGYFIARSASMPLSVVREYENKLTRINATVNMVYTYDLLKRFGSICGTSATARSFKKAFSEVYGLDVLAIEPRLPVKRVDKSIALYTSRTNKENAIVELVAQKSAIGQPVLLIVKNIGDSLHYSELLAARGIKHRVLSAQNSESSPEILAGAGVFGSVLIATQLANRGVDIKLGGDAERMTLIDMVESGTDMSKIDDVLYTVPSEEMRSSELYRTYTATLEKNRIIVAANRAKVIEAGGLCVIGSEPYTDMRIEQQMRGRAGRQGDVGESYIFESIDDEAIYVMADSSYEFMRSKVDSTNEELVYLGLIVGAIEVGKRRMHNYKQKRIAKQLDKSRRTSVSKRVLLRLIDGVANGDTFVEILDAWAAYDANISAAYEYNYEGREDRGAIGKLVSTYRDVTPEQFDHDYSAYLKELVKRLMGDVDYDMGVKLGALESVLRTAFSRHLTQMRELEQDYDQSEKKANQTLDKLYELNRASTVSDAVSEWLSMLHHVYEVRNAARRLRHTESSEAESTEDRRVGPNDPCPCGSGKKYKKCCGAQTNDNGESHD